MKFIFRNSIIYKRLKISMLRCWRLPYGRFFLGVGVGVAAHLVFGISWCLQIELQCGFVITQREKMRAGTCVRVWAVYRTANHWPGQGIRTREQYYSWLEWSLVHSDIWSKFQRRRSELWTCTETMHSGSALLCLYWIAHARRRSVVAVVRIGTESCTS